MSDAWRERLCGRVVLAVWRGATERDGIESWVRVLRAPGAAAVGGCKSAWRGRGAVVTVAIRLAEVAPVVGPDQRAAAGVNVAAAAGPTQGCLPSCRGALHPTRHRPTTRRPSEAPLQRLHTHQVANLSHATARQPICHWPPGQTRSQPTHGNSNAFNTCQPQHNTTASALGFKAPRYPSHQLTTRHLSIGLASRHHHHHTAHPAPP